jgi:transcriptional regulator with XRE-family HTH domain
MQTLKQARAARLLTVRGLAAAAGVAPSTVYLIESGGRVPRFEVIRKLCDALQVAPGEVAEFAAAIAEAGQGKDHAAALIETMAAAG